MSVAAELGIDSTAIEEALARNLTFPARWYSDPAVYDLELEHVFTRSWQLAAPAPRSPVPGTFIRARWGTSRSS